MTHTRQVMMRATFLILFIVSMLAVSTGSTVAAPSCTPTNRVATSNYPGFDKIHPSNNLVLPAGKAVEAEGNKLIIHGQVRDKNCKPLPEAMVELWQPNPFGKWTRATNVDLATPNSVFVGTGRTYTDEEGRFTFITAFPAARKGRSPFVNLRVSMKGVANYSTALFFENDVRNEKDPIYRKLSSKTRSDATLKMQQDVGGELVGTADIVLTAPSPYRTY
jgi:protocatechuate 3,4-dioxygenase beta subunit